MSREQLATLVRSVMPNAERVIPVGYAIAERFPQYDFMADVRSRNRDCVVGIKADKVFMVAKGTSLDL